MCFIEYGKQTKRTAKVTDTENSARIMATPPVGTYSASLSYYPLMDRLSFFLFFLLGMFILIKPSILFELTALLLNYSSNRIMSNLSIVVTVTRFFGENPNLSSHSPLNLITGTVVSLQRLDLMVGWIFKLLTSGRSLTFFLDVRITF